MSSSSARRAGRVRLTIRGTPPPRRGGGPAGRPKRGGGGHAPGQRHRLLPVVGGAGSFVDALTDGDVLLRTAFQMLGLVVALSLTTAVAKRTGTMKITAPPPDDE